jgi:hypothetical protein
MSLIAQAKTKEAGYIASDSCAERQMFAQLGKVEEEMKELTRRNQS